MKKFFMFGLMVLSMAVLSTAAFAVEEVGGSTLEFLDQGLIRGNWGTIIGLLIALFGLYMWLVKQETWGIMVIVGGVMVTFFPGIFDTLDSGLRTVFGEFDSTTTIGAGTDAQTSGGASVGK